MTHKDYLKQIGIEIKIARIRKDMSREAIAKATGLCNQSVMLIEQGKHDAHILTYKRITDALGISLKDVL